jgi:hypothetical protein
MKLTTLLIALSALPCFAQENSYNNLVRQTQQGSGVVWDMTGVPKESAAPSALALEKKGALFQLWTTHKFTAKEYLLDQKLVGAYLPKAEIKITAPDSYEGVAWTRIDAPYDVEITVSDLLTGATLPESAKKVLNQRFVKTYPDGVTAFTPDTVTSGPALTSSYIETNGKLLQTNVLPMVQPLAGKTADTATGEEHYVVNALAEGAINQKQLASAFVKVWPIASGDITGIAEGETIRFEVPTIQMVLTDLYPKSDIYLILYEGMEVTETGGTIVKAYPVTPGMDLNTVIPVKDLGNYIKKDGPHVLALFAKTVYGRELLDEIKFPVDRTLRVNAMQVNLTD